MLNVCSSCARHVRASDAVCPFCGTKADRTTRVVTPSRVGRSVLLAIATTACGGPNCPPTPQQSSAERPVLVAELEVDDAGRELNLAPAYGGVPAPVAIYGTVPPPCH
jgi:hypothetical protein